MKPFKYNYVIVGGNGFYAVAYSDLLKFSNVVYHPDFLSGLKSRFLKFLVKINFNIFVNRFFKTPFKCIVFKKIFPFEFDDSKDVCFIFMGAHYSVINTDYIFYLRSKYPTAKFLLFMQDILSSLPYYDIEDYKKKFDLILSYDRNDCNKYNLIYHPTPFSIVDENEMHKQERCDVFFCGAAKKRYKTILSVYEFCRKKKLKCIFFITGVPENEKISGEGLVYDKKISYLENLSYVVNCKCVLEVMQDDAVGFTPRLWEAIAYDKHLLTNNPDVEKEAFFSADRIHKIAQLDDVQVWIEKKIAYDENMKKSLSPVALLRFIESRI